MPGWKAGKPESRKARKTGNPAGNQETWEMKPERKRKPSEENKQKT